MILLNRERIETGIFFIGIGLLVLLVNIGMISWWAVGALIDFWPLIIIVIGVKIMFKRHPIVSIISWILFFSVIIGYSFYYDGSKVINSPTEFINKSIERAEETVSAELKMTLGGIKFNMNSADVELFETNYDMRNMRQEQFFSNGHKHTTIKLEPIKHLNLININDGNHSYYFNLNKDVVWSLDTTIGAGSGEIDLRELQIRDLKLKLGAGDISLYLGDKYPEGTVEINTGVGNLDVYLMESTGVKMETNGLVSKTNFIDLGWVKRGNYYYSPNYNEAEYRIDVKINMGIGKLNIIQD